MNDVADRKSVRMHGAKDGTPYLRNNWDVLIEGKSLSKTLTVDLGCGNGRNTRFMIDKGILSDNTRAYDMVDDFGEKLLLGHEVIPLNDGAADIILANYIFMFLDVIEIRELVKEISRIAAVDCRVMVELEAAKQSRTPDEESRDRLETLLKALFMANKFSFVKQNNGRFIAEKR